MRVSYSIGHQARPTFGTSHCAQEGTRLGTQPPRDVGEEQGVAGAAVPVVLAVLAGRGWWGPDEDSPHRVPREPAK